MSDTTTKARSFLDELSEDAVLDAAILRAPVFGPEDIKRVIALVGGLFTTQVPAFMTKSGDLEVMGYKATLQDGQVVDGVVTIARGADGMVTRVGSFMKPLGAVLSIGAEVRKSLGGVLPASVLI